MAVYFKECPADDNGGHYFIKVKGDWTCKWCGSPNKP